MLFVQCCVPLFLPLLFSDCVTNSKIKAAILSFSLSGPQTRLTMAAWSRSGGQCWLLLLVLLPTLLLAQDDCSHNCNNEAKRYYYVRPEGSAVTLCPAQPCLTPSQLREHFSECERNNFCQTANTTLVLLPGTYSSASNQGLFFPQIKFLTLTGYNEDCSDLLASSSIDCNGTWISLLFQNIKCLHVTNCIAFTGHDTNVEVDHVTLQDSMIRLASITAADNTEMDYNYTLGSQSYCLLQKQLADISALIPSNSLLTLRNVSFSSIFHSRCAIEYGIKFATIYAFESALDISDCLFQQYAITHISLLHTTLRTSGMVQFENANTAILVHNSTIVLAGEVYFFNNNNSAIRAGGIHSTILLAGTVDFTNNTADYGGAMLILLGGNMTIAINAHIAFQGNHAKNHGGAIYSSQRVTIAGSVQFINNSAYQQGGAINTIVSVTIADNAQVLFQGNHAKILGGAIDSSQQVTIAGSVQFINNSAYQGGAIDTRVSVIADNAQVVIQGNHADTFGGAILLSQQVTIAGSVQFINNTADVGGSIYSVDSVTITDSAKAIFQSNHATLGGSIASSRLVTIAGSVQFINNSAFQGGAIDSDGSVIIAENGHAVFEGNLAMKRGGAIFSRKHTIAGSVQFINNSAPLGGALVSPGNITTTNNAQVVFQSNFAKRLGGAIGCRQYVTIAGSVHFINNTADDHGGAISCDITVTIDNNAQVVFQGNHAKHLGGAIGSSEQVTIAGSVQFINNSAYQGGAIITHDSVITDNAHVVFQGNHADSIGGAIVSDTHVVLAGSVQFISNTAQLGGAVSMFPGPMTIVNNAKVIFQGNHAYHVGGAIYSSARSVTYSVLQSSACLISFGTNSTMDLLHNTAERGGSAMYGVTMTKLVCEDLTDGDYEYLFDIITIIPDSFSAVSSDPLRVCICPNQSTPDCLAILPDQNIPHLHYTVYPGQTFTIPAAVVGLNFAFTSGSVYTRFLSSDASLDSESQNVQGVNQTGCSQLRYSVRSDKKQETLVLTSDGRQVADIDNSIKEDIRKQNDNNITLLNSYATPFSNPSKYYINNTFITNLTDGVFRLAGNIEDSLQVTAVFISVQLLDCPPGFTLTAKHSCGCDERILMNLLNCNIADQTVRRHGNIWVNASFSGNRSNGVIVHNHCPFAYCKPEQLDVNLTHPETQCTFDHYGTLCGACKPNFSLTLGGSQCLPNCSNKYSLLLVVFILAGFALVFFIKILNLTVSQGTVNGLIFYCNIVAANRSIFFPAQYDKILSFLSVFISWLNLDLGIETCFIKGLDGYWKTWLQFVFPFYVWLIAAAIILVSHYSTRATKIFGDKSVSILATLFLLSYAKLLRSIITIFSFTTLKYPDNTTSNVWSYDGNIQYLGSKHTPLFMFALATLVLLWLPYTAVLLSAQWLRTQTHHRGLRWLKPFLDAYYGPFKDKHHYRVGVLLVVRGVLFVFFASFFAIESNVNLLLVSITSLTIPIYTSFTGRLYKKMQATILESLCFLNLGVLGIGTYHIRLVGGNQEALIATSVGIAFLQFCVITSFHSYQFVIVPIRIWYAKVRANNPSVDNTIQLQLLLHSDRPPDDDALEYMPRNNKVTQSEIRLSLLREEAEDPSNSATFVDIQVPPVDMTNNTHGEEIVIHSNSDALRPNIHPTNLTDTAANEAAGGPKESEAAVASLDKPTPQGNGDSIDQPRYFAAEREERFIDFNAPRETLLEYTQYRLPQERNEPARDSTAERELLSAPHEHPPESSEPRYFAAEREGEIDFTAPRESLLDYTQ